VSLRLSARRAPAPTYNGQTVLVGTERVGGSDTLGHLRWRTEPPATQKTMQQSTGNAAEHARSYSTKSDRLGHKLVVIRSLNVYRPKLGAKPTPLVTRNRYRPSIVQRDLRLSCRHQSDAILAITDQNRQTTHTLHVTSLLPVMPVVQTVDPQPKTTAGQAESNNGSSDQYELWRNDCRRRSVQMYQI
jgi:hypothetical protein